MQVSTGNLYSADNASENDKWSDEVNNNVLRILFNHRDLIYNLFIKDIKSRYKQSALGIAWAVIQPLSLTLIYTIVFSFIAKIDSDGIPYPIFSYAAILPWTFFSLGLVFGAECLTNNYNLITKIYFPREVFPITAILGKLVDLLLGIIIFIPLLIYYNIAVDWHVVMVVPILLIQICLMLGITFLLSAINLFYRDIRHAMPLITQIWMFLSPVIYPVSLVPDRYLSIYQLNPMAIIIDSYRQSVLFGQMPNLFLLGIAAIISLTVLVFGYIIFKRLEPAFAEMI